MKCWMMLSPERKQQVIDDIAKIIVNNKLTEMSKLMLSGFIPTAGFFGRLGFLFLFPFSIILGKSAEDFMLMMGENPNESLESLLNRINELEKTQLDDQKNNEKNPNESIIKQKLSKLKRFFNKEQTFAHE
ncbi:MAG: hypothetical protein ACFFDT_03480 [Candidatus Hodarchaeota archaeon]